MTSKQTQYEAAADRFNAISESIRPRKDQLSDALDALDAEYSAARTALQELEVAPGIPAWDHTTDPAECRVRRCKIHSQAHRDAANAALDALRVKLASA